MRLVVVFGGKGDRAIVRGGVREGFVAWTAGDHRTIWINPSDPAHFSYEGTMRHEFGHALGLSHAVREGAVMCHTRTAGAPGSRPRTSKHAASWAPAGSTPLAKVREHAHTGRQPRKVRLSKHRLS